MNTIQERAFSYFPEAKKVLFKIHRTFFGQGGLGARRHRLLEFEFEKPSLVPGENPTLTPRVSKTELNHLRVTTRWSASLHGIDVILKHLGLLRNFLRQELDRSTSRTVKLKPMRKCLDLLEDPQRIGELALIHHFISPMTGWIERSQGRNHTFSGRDRQELEQWIQSLKSTARRQNGGPTDVPNSVRRKLSGLVSPEDVDALGEGVPGLAMRLFYATQSQKIVERRGRKVKTGSKLGSRFQSALKVSRVIDVFIPSHCQYIRSEVESAVNSATSFDDFAIRFGGGEGGALTSVAEKLGISGMASDLLAEMSRYLDYVLAHVRQREEFPPLDDLWRVDPNAPFPLIAPLARAVLSLMISNAPIESAFSAWRLIDVPRRQNASDDLQYAYFFLQFNKKKE